MRERTEGFFFAEEGFWCDYSKPIPIEETCVNGDHEQAYERADMRQVEAYVLGLEKRIDSMREKALIFDSSPAHPPAVMWGRLNDLLAAARAED